MWNDFHGSLELTHWAIFSFDTQSLHFVLITTLGRADLRNAYCDLASATSATRTLLWNAVLAKNTCFTVLYDLTDVRL